MKDFIACIVSIEVKDDCIRIIGRNGEKDLHLGDYLNYMEITKIEAYGKELDICPAGMTCCLTLKRNKSTSGYDTGYFYLEKNALQRN
jgi:hypothetical protein